MYTNGYWLRITSKSGTVIWYRGVMVHKRAQSVTVMGTLRMFSESETWDVYVGAAQNLNAFVHAGHILATFVSYIYVLNRQRLTMQYSIASTDVWSPADDEE